MPTLVAQGAFSVYRSEAVRSVGGWPHSTGEDIVLTWALIGTVGRIAYEPRAIAYTTTPTTIKTFYRQRSRWARGMVHGLDRYGPAMIRRSPTTGYYVLVDYAIPWIDLCFVFVLIPGIILALFGYFYVIGWLTITVVFLNFFVMRMMAIKQDRAWKKIGLAPYRDLGCSCTHSDLHSLPRLRRSLAIYR